MYTGGQTPAACGAGNALSLLTHVNSHYGIGVAAHRQLLWANNSWTAATLRGRIRVTPAVCRPHSPCCHHKQHVDKPHITSAMLHRCCAALCSCYRAQPPVLATSGTAASARLLVFCAPTCTGHNDIIASWVLLQCVSRQHNSTTSFSIIERQRQAGGLLRSRVAPHNNTKLLRAVPAPSLLLSPPGSLSHHTPCHALPASRTASREQEVSERDTDTKSTRTELPRPGRTGGPSAGQAVHCNHQPCQWHAFCTPPE